MTKRTRWVIGNWKMNGTLASNSALLEGLTAAGNHTAHVGICAPFPYLAQCQRALATTAIRYGAQDVSEHTSGAFTGQTSASMLREFGATLVLVGHSERRLYNAESSEQVAAKALVALSAGLIPVICVGETLAERESGLAEQTVEAQLAPCRDIFSRLAANVVVAYEPVWAIGTGKTASPDEAQSMHAFIRRKLTGINTEAGNVSILYGGSVKAANAGELFTMPDIDGGLVGGASLVLHDFVGIISAA